MIAKLLQLFQFLLGCYRRTTKSRYPKKLPLSIPFRMLQEAVAGGVKPGTGGFQFLLGCYPHGQGNSVRRRPAFQFLLGCYKRREEARATQWGQFLHFQFLLGCYQGDRGGGVRAGWWLSIPFRMLQGCAGDGGTSSRTTLSIPFRMLRRP